MSIKNFKFVSPGIFINEIDKSFRADAPTTIGPVIIGRSQKGLAMTPTRVENYQDFVAAFGDTVPGKGGGDVYRNGNNQSPMYGTYAARAFLDAQVAPITYIRLLGQQSVNQDGTISARAGWQTTANPSAGAGGIGGGAYGLFVQASSSITTDIGAAEKSSETGSFHLGAIIYSDGGVPLLSGALHGNQGHASVGAPTLLTASLCAFIDSDASGQFKIKFLRDGGTEEVQVSFDDSSGNFIRKRMNTNPTLISSGNFYPGSAKKNYWLGESYEQYLRDNVTSLGGNMVGIMLPLGTASVTPTQGPSKMKGISSQEAKAGWFCAQDFGPNDGFAPYTTQKLFRLKGRGHGEWLHKNAKVTIERIRAPVSLDQEYGSFSVVLRAIQDTDANPQVLERFDNLNLDPTSPNFISKVIGDTYYKWDEINTRLRKYGDYDNESKYVYVELNDDVAAGASNPACVPFGYYGPPKYASVQVSSSNAPANCWKNTGPQFEGIIITGPAANLYGGVDSSIRALTGGIDGNMRATLTFPSAPLVKNVADSGLTDPTRVNFGMRSTRTATSNAPAVGLGDMHRMLDAEQADDPSGKGAAKANGGYHGFGYIMTLDDVMSGSVKSGLRGFAYRSGSRAQGQSLTATASNDYRTLLDFGYDSFTAPFFGGFDGFDITKPDPVFQKGMTGASNVKNSYIFQTYKQSLEMVSDPELLDFNVLAVPGLTNESLTNYQMQLCEDRRDAMAIIDLPNVYTPFSEDYVDATARANRDVRGTVTALRNRRVDTSYACTFYPWVQTRDANTGQTLWVPPSVAMMGVLASSQAKADVWFAPAGFNRGGLSDGAAGIPILNVASRLSSKERDMLYDGKINPIASFPSSGIVVFGQKTLQMRPSALDRINVRRLVIFLKKQISVLSTQVLFEQNVQATWDRFKGLIEPFLANVKTRYGISEYRLVLDETTTTPDLIDQNILYAKIMIKPARAIEFIAIDFIIANTGASFDD